MRGDGHHRRTVLSRSATPNNWNDRGVDAGKHASKQARTIMESLHMHCRCHLYHQCLKCGWMVKVMDGVQPLLGPVQPGRHTLWSIDSLEN